jgi:hypothetical protein
MLDKLKIAKYRFVLEAIEPMHLPPFNGGALRGAFGQVFKRMACLQKGDPCNTCLEADHCAYRYVFETPVPRDSEVLRTHEAVPRPFVFEPPLDGRTSYIVGDELPFGLILIGHGIDYLPYFILAFKELGSEGLGRGRGRFRLKQVWVQDPLGPWQTLIYDGPTDALRNIQMNMGMAEVERAAAALPDDKLTVRFITPTSLKHEGKLAQEPAFYILVRALVRRVSSLSYFHCGQRWVIDYKRLIEQAEQVEIAEAAVSWQGWARYSSRQGRWLDMNGVVGWLRFAGPLANFRSLLVLGGIVHVGKACVFGNGQYQVDAPFAKGHTLDAF